MFQKIIEKFKQPRFIFYLIAAISAMVAANFADGYANNVAEAGGAAGFAVLSGLALVAAAITYLRKEDN